MAGGIGWEWQHNIDIAAENLQRDQGLDLCPPADTSPTGVSLLDRAVAILSARAAVEKPVVGASMFATAIGTAAGGVIFPTKSELFGIAIHSTVVEGSGPPTGLMLLEGGDSVLLETSDGILLEGLF